MAFSLPASHDEKDAWCASCRGDLEHCHGVAIVEGDVVNCSDDPDCRVPADLHDFISLNEDRHLA